MKICAPLLADTGGKATNGLTDLDIQSRNQQSVADFYYKDLNVLNNAAN